jgi:hypothetical protein
MPETIEPDENTPEEEATEEKPKRVRAATPTIPEDDKTFLWRLECLERAGYPQDAAKRLAADRRLDLHATVAALDGGLTVEQALDLVESLED